MAYTRYSIYAVARKKMDEVVVVVVVVAERTALTDNIRDKKHKLTITKTSNCDWLVPFLSTITSKMLKDSTTSIYTDEKQITSIKSPISCFGTVGQVMGRILQTGVGLMVTTYI